MKTETEIRNLWRTIRKIHNNANGTFDWDDLKSAIEKLVEMKIDMALYIPILNIPPEVDD